MQDILEKKYFEGLEDVWSRLKGCGKPVYIYGMGNGSDKILNEFSKRNILCSGILASDDFVRGQEFRGFEVRKLSSVSPSEDAMIVLAFGTSLKEIMERIEGLEEKFEVLAPETSVIGNDCFEKERFLDIFNKAQHTYSLLSDDISRKTFINITAFKITGKLSYLRQCFCDGDKNSLLELKDNESYFDFGAYNGDTISEFISAVRGKYKHITAFEPDRHNFQKCVKNTCAVKNISLYNCAAWDKQTLLNFSNSSGRQSTVVEIGKQVYADCLDNVAKNGCTYVKYDVEGADYEALLGSVQTIRKYSPKICAAVYHRPYDYIYIPLLINLINGDYRFYLRQSPYYPCWETNIFCKL